jgi:LmbE family N-acetylglucosaminyl deacetylase
VSWQKTDGVLNKIGQDPTLSHVRSSHDLVADAMRRPAFIFAHADDAVLSAFAVLSAPHENALDIVACGGVPKTSEPGPWDRLCGFASSRAAKKTRMAEQLQICKNLGLTPGQLDLIDSQYETQETTDIRTTVSQAETLCRQASCSVIVTHRPDAMHIDHQRVAAVAKAVATRLGKPIIQVCDRPYIDCSNEGCDNLTGRGIRLNDLLWQSKQQAIQIYLSQLSALASAFGTGWSARNRVGWECYELIIKSSLKESR